MNMQERKGKKFRRIDWRPEGRFSDKFSDEDIERAWCEACKKVGEFVMPERNS